MPVVVVAAGIARREGARHSLAVRERLGHVDDLKILLTAGVIAAHAAITYGAEGS